MNKNPDIRNGLVVGKFCPLHKGHEDLLNAATTRSDKLFVISYTKPEFPGYGPDKREVWLKKIYPRAEILVLNDDLSHKILGHYIPDNDADEIIHRDYCARICRDYFKMEPDAVFTCESYGDGFADYLSKFFKKDVRHILVGELRTQNSVSGTKVRANIHAFKDNLSPFIYADFVKTVCFLGAESTGKSTLSALCAQQYQTAYIDEFGRSLWERKDGHLTFDDMLLIAETHISSERHALSNAHEFLFIDTSPLTTLFYSLQMFGTADPKLYQFVERKYDQVFLCAPDFPLIQDGTRQDEEFRQRQHAWYLQELKERNVPYRLLKGPIENRLETIKTTLLS